MTGNNTSSLRVLRTPERGFTLLIAVLVGSLLLAIGFSIFAIGYKELLLTSAGKESHVSFFSADSAMECALFWDQTQDSFNVTSPMGTITCGGIPLTVTSSVVGTTYLRTFSMTLAGGAQCATVQVQKIRDSNPRTQIDSYGYNTCVLTSLRRTERGLRVLYPE